MVTRLQARLAMVMAGVAGSLVIAAAPASAQQAVIYVQVPQNFHVEHVAYWDLNLATRAGEQALWRRVDQAIGDVCLEDKGRWYGMSEPDYNHCRWGAWSRARPQVIGAVYRARQMASYQRRPQYVYYRRY